MDAGLYVYQSNSVEVLSEWLHQALFQTGAPLFHDRLIVVPHAALRSWVQYRLAALSPTGVAMGMQLLTEGAALSVLLGLLADQAAQGRQLPSSYELALAIERLLLEWGATQWPEDHSGVSRSLRDLVDQPNFSRSKHLRRVGQLSLDLAQLYDRYGRYGGQMLTVWRSSSPTHWQHWLWQRLLVRHPQWITLHEWVDSIRPTQTPQRPLTIAFFGTAYLHPLLHKLLEKLSRHAAVAYFLPSACQHYDGDLRVRWGKVSRLMAAAMDPLPLAIQRAFYIPEAFNHISSYSERATEDTRLYPVSKITLLHRLQADLILLRQLGTGDPQQISSNDHSIQLHLVPTRFREVEVLYHFLLDQVHRHSTQLTPRDILVLVPDLSLYESAIEAVFKREESPFAIRLCESSLLNQSQFVQAFQALLAVVASRWEVSTILHLLDFPCLTARFHWTPEDCDQLREWTEESTITWGWDVDHRQKLLKQAHCIDALSADASLGTWTKGIQLLLKRLAQRGQGDRDSVLSFSDTELFGRWAVWLQALWSDLQPLRDDVALTITDWTRYLICLVDAYLLPADSAEEQERAKLIELIRRLETAKRSLPSDAHFPFSTLHRHLRSWLVSETALAGESELQAVRFGAFRSLVGEPARVVAMLGMDETAFPCKVALHAMDLLRDDAEVAKIPSAADLDRHAFLQAVLSARDTLYMSYVGTCLKDGKKQEPSLLVAELQSHLNRGYKVGKKGAGEFMVRKHPFLPFDAGYFQSAAQMRSYSQTDYAAATALAESNRQPAAGFLPQLFTPFEKEPEPDPDVVQLSYRELKQAVRNPLQLFLQRQADMRLRPWNEASRCDEEPLQLDNLERYQLREAAMRQQPNSALRDWAETRRAPLGPFADLLGRETVREIEERQQGLKQCGCTLDEMVRFELAEHCRQPRQLAERVWQLPAVSVPVGARQVLISGALDEVTPKGIVCFKKASPKEILRFVPQLLLLQALEPYITQLLGHSLPLQVLFVDEGKSEPREIAASSEALADFVHYALTCLGHPSPLIEDWIVDFVKSSSEEMRKKLTKMDFGRYFFNEEAKWLFKDGLEPANLDYWRRKAQQVYSSHLDAAKKKGAK